MQHDNLAHSLKILKLPASAKDADVKTAYRTLARQWHPDLNSAPGAAEKFIAIDTAYKNAIELLKAIEASIIDRNRIRPRIQREPAPAPKQPKTPPPPLSKNDKRIKTQTLTYINTLTKRQIYRVAIAEIEILKATIAENLEVNVAQAKIYMDYGIYLVDCDRLNKCSYLFQASSSNRSVSRTVAEN